MIKTLSVLLTLLVFSIVGVYVTERSATPARLTGDTFMWFIAIKHGPQALEDLQLQGENRIGWRSRADSVFVGEAPLYWEEFFLVTGNDQFAHPIVPDKVADSYIVRLETLRLPIFLTGTYSWLHKLGLWRAPDLPTDYDISTSSFDDGLGPSIGNIETLRSRPISQQPAMINFLRFAETAQYDEAENPGKLSGREAYDQYGQVAFKAVYSLGGQLVVAGKIVEVIKRPKGGPTRGEWDDIAIMQYPSQRAILALEQVPDYSEALVNRNAGLTRTRIIASLGY